MLKATLFSVRCARLSGMLIAVIIALHVLHAPGAWADPKVIDRIAAVVNDEIISLYELNQAIRPYEERLAAMGYPPEEEAAARYKLRGDVLNQLIDKKLTSQEIKRLNITVSEQEIDGAIERIKSQSFRTEEDLVEALKQQGLTLEEYRARIKEQILRTKLVNREVKSKIVITREDISEYYNAHPEKYRFEKEYHLRTILISVPPLAEAAEKAAARERLAAIRRECLAGASFAEMARQHSDGPMADDGGFLGTFELEELNQVLQTALADMDAGDITDMLDTGQGYQIFYVDKITNASARSLEEAAPEIEEQLYNEIINREFQSWLAELRKTSVIKIIQ